MKNKFLLIIGAIISVSLLGYGTNYLLSHHKASFIFENGTTNITVYREDKTAVGKVTENRGSLQLKKGSYYAVPQGPHLSSDPITIMISDKDVAYTIKPNYSTEYLRELLATENTSINDAITKKYPSLMPNYKLVSGNLYRQGDWFGGLLKPKVRDEGRDRRDPYRIILQKTNGVWQVVRRPEYVLTSSRYQNVPIEILRSVNSLAE